MEASATTVVTGARALIGKNLEVTEDAVVVLQDEVVVAAGARSEIPVPSGSTVVDARGLTLLPGFIDSHVHIGFARPSEVLSGGVTTVRDLAWRPEDIWGLVADSRTAGFPGPQILAAGQMLTVSGGYPTRAAWAPEGTGRVVASPAEAKEAVAEQAEAGACIIKVALNAQVGPTLDPRTLSAIIEAAHTHDLRVTGHVYGLSELHKALDAGMDELAHMLMSPESLPTTTIERMIAQSMAVVPTLGCFFHDAQAIAVSNLRSFIGAGGRVVYGTDLGNEGPRPGIDPREVDALTRAGMSTIDIVRAATTGAAEYLGLRDRGALEAGLLADLVAVVWTPGRAALELTQVAMVWRRGNRIR
jgi:imidazolonepropionase-like amidohydrolase